MGCSWTTHNVTWYLYPYHYLKNTEIYNWNTHLKPSRIEQQYHIIQHTILATPTFGIFMFLRISLFHLRKHQNSASLAFVRGIHRGPLNSPHKWPVTRKTLPFDDVIMMIIGPHKTTTYHLPIEKPHEIWRKVAMLYRRLIFGWARMGNNIIILPTQDILPMRHQLKH